MSNLRAPFPYFGGKRRIADLVWQRFGKVDRYIEPFAGSLAVLLAAPEPAPKEIVSDTNGYIVNFWRSVQNDPDAVAYHAEYPTLHHDLTARQHTLWKWYLESDKLLTDPRYYNTEIAGWWVWGTSNSIAGNYAVKRGVANDSKTELTKDSAPGVHHQIPKFTTNRNDTGGVKMSGLIDRIPHVAQVIQGGKGISAETRLAQRGVKPSGHVDGVPRVPSKRHGGKGVATSRVKDFDFKTLDSDIPDRYESWMRIEIFNYMRQIQSRLRRVTTLNRPFTSFITPTIAGFTDTVKLDTAIFLDPPYRTEQRSDSLYASDYEGTSSDVAVESYAWAIANGNDFKIAYCMHEGDFAVPDDWTSFEQSFAGHHTRSRGKHLDRVRDQVIFSPKCLKLSVEGSLFND